MSRQLPLTLLLLITLVACSDDGTGPDGGPAPTDRLQGASGALAATAIPRLAYEPSLQDYSTDHPHLPGLRLSTCVLNLVLRPLVTVGEANALLDAFDVEIVGGIPGTATLSGILALRLPTKTHAEMESALAELRGDARVAHAAQDQLSDELEVPAADASLPDWSWDLAPNGGNWGLEISRVPQLWNLNAAVRKVGDTPSLTGVLDAGFAAQHADVGFLNAPPAGTNPGHGTHVAGIIGAHFGNGVGIDGVNPFARLEVALLLSSVWDLYAFLSAHPELAVVNVSMGGAWSDSTDLNTDPDAQTLANEQGATMRQMLALVQAALGSLPVIVTAASNDSDESEGVQPAAYASALNNAGLLQGAENIIVVEALNLVGGVATRRPTSNTGGHVSAPGGDILSTIPNTYGIKGGTSMAAPHVTGLVGYLYALDPALPRATLSSNPVRALIVATAVPAAGGASARMDAFAAAMALDSLHGNDRVLRLLADLDDGTPDGNTRLNADGSVNTAEDADGDGGRGDGTIDMSDFRRWRDAFLDLDQPEGYVLDGDPTHPKRDLNGNGRTTAEGDDEFIYPWLDLNGDAKVALAQRAYVGGAIRAQVTDLEVLMARFEDEDYPASQLSQLIHSGDAHVDASVCLARPEVAGVRSWVEVTASGILAESRSHEVAAPLGVYTLAANALGWTLHLEGLDGSGQVVGETELEIDVKPGSDHHWKPDCVTEVRVSVTPQTVNVQAGETVQFSATVTGTLNTQVAWTTTQPGGTVSGTGLFTASSTIGTFRVIASSVAEPTAQDTALVTVTGTPAVIGIFNEFHSIARGAIQYPTYGQTLVEEDVEQKHRAQDVTFTPVSATLVATESRSWPDLPETSDNESGSASGDGATNGSLSFDLDSSGRIRSFDFSAASSGSASSNSDDGFGGGQGQGSTSTTVYFSVGGTSPVTVIMQGTCSAGSTHYEEHARAVLSLVHHGGEILVNRTCRSNGALDYTVTLAPGDYHVHASAEVSAEAGAPTVTSTSASASITLVVRFVP